VTGEPIVGARTAVTEWLLAAARDRTRAVDEWDTDGMTILKCGTLFSAVRISVPLVEAAARHTDPKAVSDFLYRALFGGPVIRCNLGQWFYVLVPAGFTGQWKVPDSERLERGTDLGVPRPGIDVCPGPTGSYWAVTMGSPGDLADPRAVAQLVMQGRHNRATGWAS
jgi:hypothetical protein